MGLKEMLKMDVKDLAYKFKRFFPKYIPKPIDLTRDYVVYLNQIYGRQPSLNMGRFSTTSDIEKIKDELRGYRFI